MRRGPKYRLVLLDLYAIHARQEQGEALKAILAEMGVTPPTYYRALKRPENRVVVDEWKKSDEGA